MNDNEIGRHFQQLYDEGKQFTEDILRENERLRQQLALVRRGHAAPEAAPRDFHGDLARTEEERDRLAAELDALNARLSHVETENQEFADRYLKIERQNSNFASLYVASYQLHSSLDLDVVLQRINEVVINMVGAEVFAIYLHDLKDDAFVLAGGEGLARTAGHRVPCGDNLLTRVAKGGQQYIANVFNEIVGEDHPLAIVPLKTDEELVGALAIYKLFVQKTEFEPIDRELFDLLAGHAATAITAAQIFRRAQRRASTLEGLIEIARGP